MTCSMESICNRKKSQRLYHIFLKTYCIVEAPAVDKLKKSVQSSIESERAKIFLNQSSGAITNNSITPEQYEKVTGEAFNTQEDLNKWLKELWYNVFGYE